MIPPYDVVVVDENELVDVESVESVEAVDAVVDEELDVEIVG